LMLVDAPRWRGQPFLNALVLRKLIQASTRSFRQNLGKFGIASLPSLVRHCEKPDSLIPQPFV
jgi:hypothetical protein